MNFVSRQVTSIFCLILAELDKASPSIEFRPQAFGL